MSDARVTDYDGIADRFDTRYSVYEYAGVRETLLNFLGDAPAVLEAGCGTGHWLAIADARLKPSRYDDARLKPSRYDDASYNDASHDDASDPCRAKAADASGAAPGTRSAKASAERLVGVDPSGPMLARAASRGSKGSAERLLLARARAEELPFADASF